MNAQLATFRPKLGETASKALRLSLLGCIVIAAAGFNATIARAGGAIGQYGDNGVFCSPASRIGEINRVYVEPPRMSLPVATGSGGIVVGVGGGAITTGSMSLHQQWVAYRADLYQWNGAQYVLIAYGPWTGPVSPHSSALRFCGRIWRAGKA